MSDISPEDRERLVDIRFGELFDRHLSAKLPEVFDNRLMEWAALSSEPQPARQPVRATPQRPLPPNDTGRTKRRSLLEISMSEMLGMSG